MVSTMKDVKTTEETIEAFWVRHFQSIKKQYDPKEKTAKAKSSEIKISQLANKRRKLHCDLRLQADNEVINSLLVDLLYYNILDFVTTRQDAGTKSILGNQYTVIKEHLKSLYTLEKSIENEVDGLITAETKKIRIFSKEIVKYKTENNKGCKAICSSIFRLIKLNPFGIFL
ncbi:hypothetical protein BDF21DRAFT_476556 [Thamnidium elegans]|nr:hypothetical protein BDF21DRAFT_476556 [Thamnidium elegans]